MNAVTFSASDGVRGSGAAALVHPQVERLNPATIGRSQVERLTPAAIGRAATLALHDELALTPKPGLVTLVDNGSHDDMDAHTFMRSLFALRRYFVQIAEAGHEGAAFPELERCGIAAEARMLAATKGINTHRGAIFMLGLLCAAAGAITREGGASITLFSVTAVLVFRESLAKLARNRCPGLAGKAESARRPAR